MGQHLIQAISEGVATLTLNRPDRLNALCTPIMEGLLEALPRLARDTGVGVIVLTGAGRAFCAGGDVKSMAERSAERSVEEAVIHLRGRMEVSRLLHEISKAHDRNGERTGDRQPTRWMPRRPPPLVWSIGWYPTLSSSMPRCCSRGSWREARASRSL